MCSVIAFANADVAVDQSLPLAGGYILPNVPSGNLIVSPM
jgi:hypothetical protein